MLEMNQFPFFFPSAREIDGFTIHIIWHQVLVPYFISFQWVLNCNHFASKFKTMDRSRFSVLKKIPNLKYFYNSTRFRFLRFHFYLCFGLMAVHEKNSES